MSVTSLFDFLHKNRLSLAVLCTAVGIPLIVFSSLRIFLYKEGDFGSLLSTVHDSLGDWAYWVLTLGVVLLVVGIYYVYSFIKLLKEFKKLMDISSKSKFIKNLDRIEELAWRLHPRYEKIVLSRKQELKIK